MLCQNNTFDGNLVEKGDTFSMDRSFVTLKDKIVNEHILHFPNWNMIFHAHVDA
jgi:hypothetical protein